MSRKCQITCQAVAPWERRALARNTGLKCEKRAMPKAYKALLAKSKAERKAPLL